MYSQEFEVTVKCPSCGKDMTVFIESEVEYDISIDCEEIVNCQCGCKFKQEIEIFITLDVTAGKQFIINEDEEEEVFVDKFTGDLFSEDNPMLRSQ